MIADRRPDPSHPGKLSLRALRLLVCSAALCASAALHAATDIVLVLDNSGSMRGNDPQFLLKRAVSGFVSGLDAETRLGVVIFAEKAEYKVPLAALDVDTRSRVDQVITAIDYRGQLTDSPAAIERAIYELKKSARADATKVIVFMTDGIVDTGNKATDAEKAEWMREELATDAADNGIKVFGIAFTENADFFLIQSLAKTTGGAYFRALTPDDLGQVFTEVQEKLIAPPAPPAPPPVAAPAPAPAAPAPSPAPTTATAAGDCLSTLAADERTALEEMSVEAGLTAEQLCLEMQSAPEGTAVVITPPGAQPDKAAIGVFIVLGAAALLIAVAVVAFLLWRRRPQVVGGGGRQGPPAERVPDAFLKDIHRITSEPAIQLGAKPVMIARVRGADTTSLDYFIIDKGTVGRRHAIIRYHDFAFWIADQGSVNGTFLNGERIENERQLKHGDSVRFHKYEFEFSMPEMEDAGHTVFADPNEKTMVGDATSFGATAALAVAAAPVPARAHDVHNPDDDDVFDLTGDGVAAPAAEEDDEAFATALSARARAKAADLGDETEEGDSAAFPAPVARPPQPVADDDNQLRTVGPSYGASRSEQSDSEFDQEASAFFDEDDLGATAGPPLRAQNTDDDGVFEDPPEAATMIRPAAQLGDMAGADDDSESATLMPGAMHAPDEALEATSDISLDDFMRTETFDGPVLGLESDVDDGDDRTLMPNQVPERTSSVPAIDDVLDLTAEQTIQPVGPDDDDEESEGETRFPG